MATQNKHFTYRPLKESKDFRLLELFSGNEEDTIKCSLNHSSLTSGQRYHAASYTWGSPGTFREIELDGIGHRIQPNLFDFLQQLRRRIKSVSITLWVDALCINQNDLSEKSVQVPLMGVIYSTAESVLVWLGSEADGSELYFDYCNQATESAVQTDKTLPVHRQYPMDKSNTIASLSTAIASVQRRNYWTRTWIIQEIVLAPIITVFCGNRSTNWPSFCLSMPENDVDNHQIGMKNPIHHFGRLRKLRNIAERLTLRQLLFQCHMSRCSEPRDLVYALLNIAKDTMDSPDSIVPDYHSPLETLFLQTMSACSFVNDGILCLQFCDTLATRLGVDPEKIMTCANDIVQSSPGSEIANKLASRSFFAKLTRFARPLIESPPTAEIWPPNQQQLKHFTIVSFLVQNRCISCGVTTSQKQKTRFSFSFSIVLASPITSLLLFVGQSTTTRTRKASYRTASLG